VHAGEHDPGQGQAPGDLVEAVVEDRLDQGVAFNEVGAVASQVAYAEDDGDHGQEWGLPEDQIEHLKKV